MTVYSTPAPPHRFSTEGGKQYLTLELPSLESLQGVDLDISTTEIRLVLPGSGEQLRMCLPHELKASGAPMAKFSRKRRELTLTWDSVPLSEPTPLVQTPEPTSQEAETATLPQTPEPSSAKNVEATVPSRDDGPGVDCMEFLEDEIEESLKRCAIEQLKSIAPLRGAAVLPSDFEIKGEAFIKNKCCDFKASVSFRWEMLDAIGGFLGAAGTVDIPELTRDQTAPKVLVNVFKGGSAQARAAGDWMKRHGAELISECLNGESLGAKVFSAWDEAAWETEAPKESDAAPKPKLDQESLTLWSKAWLEEKLGHLTVKLFGGSASATFAAPQVSGEVSISGTGNDGSADFKLQLDSSWTIATSIGQTTGTLHIADFTRALGSEGPTINVEAAPGKKASGQLLTALRQTGVSAVRGLLAQFITELQLHVKR